MPIPEIVDGQITDIGGKQSRPVYFLTIAPSPGPNVVVKGEQGGESRFEAAASVAWSSKIMGAVNNAQVGSVPLMPREVEAFKRAVTAKFPPGDPRLFALTDPVLVWVKMPFVAGLSDADPTVERGRFHVANFTNSRDAITKLYDRNVWLALGKVVAVDLFNGNNDRFSDEGKWTNQGNIMFAGGAVIGLDTYDPNSDFGRLTGAQLGIPPGLKVLKDLAARRLYAEKCVKSVGKILHDNLKETLGQLDHFAVELKTGPEPGMTIIELSTVLTLFDEFWHPFYEGIGQGVNDLKTKLTALVGPPPRPTLNRTPGVQNLGAFAARPALLTRQEGHANLINHAMNQVPPAVIERMQYLGWR